MYGNKHLSIDIGRVTITILREKEHYLKETLGDYAKDAQFYEGWICDENPSPCEIGFALFFDRDTGEAYADFYNVPFFYRGDYQGYILRISDHVSKHPKFKNWQDRARFKPDLLQTFVELLNALDLDGLDSAGPRHERGLTEPKDGRTPEFYGGQKWHLERERPGRGPGRRSDSPPEEMAMPDSRDTAESLPEEEDSSAAYRPPSIPRLTAAYPEVIAPSHWYMVELFLYLKEYRNLVQKEILSLENREGLDYSKVSTELPKSLPVGCPVRFSLESNSLRCNPSELTINWYEPYNRLPFRIATIDDSEDGYSASFELDLFVDNLLVASMRLPIAVTSNIPDERPISAVSDAQWYERIFASYAREDLELVEHLKKRYEALGFYMFIDLDDLRSGVSWQTEIAQRIEGSDLFQLFWSDDARRSEFVATEWKHALLAQEIKGGRFIRPIYWQDPIAAVPEELSKINFRKISFGDS